MSRDAQNVVIKGGVKGNLATTSFGPRTTNHNTASSRPMSWTKRELVLQCDGDTDPAVVADFANNTRDALPKGCFIVSAVAFSSTGASVALTAVDVDANSAPLGTLAPVAGGWAAVRDIDVATGAKTQLEWTIAAGEKATVVVEYFQTEEGVDGVLAKAVAGADNATI